MVVCIAGGMEVEENLGQEQNLICGLQNVSSLKTECMFNIPATIQVVLASIYIYISYY